jgi:hypothetical protein
MYLEIFFGTNEKNFIAKRNKEHNPKASGWKTAHTTKGHKRTRKQ